jgi:T5SS/PEP-CTERM-associated repeat protein
MTVQTGGTAAFDATLAMASAGSIHLDGGTIIAHAFDRSVGSFGFQDGTLQVNGGVYTQATGSNTAANVLTLNGATASANPTFQLTGGATTSGVNAVIVGDTKQGSLYISGGSVLSNSGNGLNLGTHGALQVDSGSGYLGLNAGSSGTATVTGANSQWSNTQNLLVGLGGNGTLNVQDGGMVTNKTGALGVLFGSSGTAMVTGPNSQWNNTGDLHVGNFGSGTLNVTGGGAVNVAGATYIWHGTVTVGSGSSFSTATLDLEEGVLNLSGSLTASQVLVNGGELINNGSMASAPVTDNGGSVHGSGNFGAVTINGGTFSPGNSPGTATDVTTNWTGGAYVWEINKALGNEGVDPGWDLWHTGTLAVAPGFSIDVTSLTAGNLPGNVVDFNSLQNYAWRIATSINHAFSATNLALLNSSLNTSSFSNAFGGAFFLTSGAADDDLVLNYSSAAAVPEPTGLLMLALVLGPALGVAARRRRRMRCNSNVAAA